MCTDSFTTLGGCFLLVEGIVHFYSYPRGRALHTGRWLQLQEVLNASRYDFLYNRGKQEGDDGHESAANDISEAALVCITCAYYII